MKKTIVLSVMILAVAGFANFMGSSTAHSSTSGAAAGKTGSPGDGSNCTQCHTGTATVVPGLITSNIPAGGYTPGYTYQITATVTYVGRVKFGFEISPQNTSGTLLGTIGVTNTTETKTVGAGKYITHKTAGTSGVDGRTWTFNWTAPAAGTGPVTFYGAFNCTNNLNNSAGDIIYNSTLTVNEDLSSVSETEIAQRSLKLFPTLADDRIFIEPVFGNDTEGESTVYIYSIDGRIAKKLEHIQPSDGTIYEISVSDLSQGAYIAVFERGDRRGVQRFIKN